MSLWHKPNGFATLKIQSAYTSIPMPFFNHGEIRRLNITNSKL